MSIPTNAPIWEPIVDALRAELQEYGELLILIEKQQTAIQKRNMPSYLDLSAEIESQAASTSGLRAEREQKVRSLAETLNIEYNENLSEMIPGFPAESRPMFSALVDEINKLIHKTQRKAKQNHMLLVRTLHFTHELLQKVSPQSFTQTYSPAGNSSFRANRDSRAVNTSA